MDFDMTTRFQITNTMLYIVTPLYAVYILFTLIFLIVSSKRLELDTIGYNGAVFASNLLLQLSYFAVAFSVLSLSVNREKWDVNGGTIQPSLFSFIPQNCGTVFINKPFLH